MVFSLLLLLKKWENFLYFLKMNILFIFEKMGIFSLKTSWLFGKVYFEKEAIYISWVSGKEGFENGYLMSFYENGISMGNHKR